MAMTFVWKLGNGWAGKKKLSAREDDVRRREQCKKKMEVAIKKAETEKGGGIDDKHGGTRRRHLESPDQDSECTRRSNAQPLRGTT